MTTNLYKKFKLIFIKNIYNKSLIKHHKQYYYYKKYNRFNQTEFRRNKL